MRLNKLYLKNYRNYEELNIEFSKNLVIFLGENAQGKTNLLESIYVLAMTRSHRTSSEQELIGWTDDQAMIQGEITKGSSTLPLEILLSKKGRKTKINHIEQKKKYLRGTNECHFICTRRSFFSKRQPADQAEVFRYGIRPDQSNLSL